MEILEEIMSELAPLGAMGPVTLFLIIFFNNSIKTFLMMTLGIFFGIAPAIFLISNGYILGVVAYLVGTEDGVSSVLVGIIPHGIVELPVVIIASAYGFWLGSRFILTLRHGESIRYHIKNAMHTYLHILVPLFFFAAFVEVFVTDFLLNLL